MSLNVGDYVYIKRACDGNLRLVGKIGKIIDRTNAYDLPYNVEFGFRVTTYAEMTSWWCERRNLKK